MGWFSSAWDHIKDAASAVVDTVTDATTGAWDTITSGDIGGIANLLTGGVSGAIADAASGDWKGAADNLLSGGVTEAIDKANEEEISGKEKENFEYATHAKDREEAIKEIMEEYGVDEETARKYVESVDTSSGDWEAIKKGFRDENGNNYTEKLIEEAGKQAEAAVQVVEDTKQQDTDESAAAQATQLAEAQEAQNAQTNAQNAGVNRSRAGLLGSNTAAADAGTTYNNAYTALRNQSASTQADYLQKMGQSTALQNQAENMEKGLGYATVAGGLQGAGSGAAMGATISDERMKENPDEFDDKLNEAVQQFKQLYKELKELKESK